MLMREQHRVQQRKQQAVDLMDRIIAALRPDLEAECQRLGIATPEMSDDQIRTALLAWHRNHPSA